MENLEKQAFGPHQLPKQFVLCFDGTGNKFAGDASDTNLVKIYRVSICLLLDCPVLRMRPPPLQELICTSDAR